MENIDREIIAALIEGNQQSLQVLAYTAMTWWVSSTAFCAAIVVAVWTFKDNFEDLYKNHSSAYWWFMSLILAFFLSFVFYSLVMIISVSGLEEQLVGLIEAAGTNIAYTYYEFTIVKRALMVGTTSFFILTVIWIILLGVFYKKFTKK